MKKMLLKLSDSMLSRSQMKEVKGGLEYWEEGADKCACTFNDTMEKCNDMIYCVYGSLHYSLNKNGCLCP